MPAMTETEIKAKIADGTVFGVSIDTAIFDKYGCNLDSTVLKSLTQFREGPITLLFSEIVVNEIRNHIARDAQETQRHLNRALTNQSQRWKTSIDISTLPAALALLDVPTEAAETQFNDYLAAVGGEVVSTSGIDISTELMRRYFATEPPFQST